MYIKKGVNEIINIGTKKISIPSGAKIKISFTWNTGKKEYGHAAFLAVTNKHVKSISHAGPVIFEVCHDWRKIMRQVSYPVYHNYFNPDSPKSSAENCKKRVRLSRKWGYNCVEFYGPYQPMINNPTPKEDIWSCFMHDAPGVSKTIQTSMISKKVLKRWINEYHNAGIKVACYIHSPRYTTPNENWHVYDPASGKRILDAASTRAQQAWFRKKGIGFPNSLKFCEEYGKKLAEAVREYDWDACFIDSYNKITTRTARGVNKDGKALTNLTEEELHAKGLELLVSPSRKIKDNFLIVPNGLHHLMVGLQFFPSRDMFEGNNKKFPWLKSAKQKCVFGGEWRDLRRQANTPWQLARSLRAVKEATKTPVFCIYTIAYPPPWSKNRKNLAYTYKVETVKPYMALILANGLGYWDSFGFWSASEDDPVALAKISYLKFAARYGQYLYDLNIHWIARGMVKVDAPDHVYWKGNCFERKFSNHREVYVHLVNFDKMYLIAKVWDPTRKVPQKVKNIPIEIKLREGENNVQAFFLNPDGNHEPKCLPVKISGSKAKIIIPTLEYWDMLVVRISKK